LRFRLMRKGGCTFLPDRTFVEDWANVTNREFCVRCWDNALNVSLLYPGLM
jgi:hypothetical protein